jgi:PAS domain S-box-containing protein
MKSEPLRVLVLEADDGDHERILRHAGSAGRSLRIERAASGPEFEAALKRAKVDLILADHNVPGYDGMAALGAALAALPAVPYIIVSGPIGEDRAAECLRLGARDFVHKERLERLPGAIARALQEPPGGRPRSDAHERFEEMARNIREVFWVCSADASRVLYLSPAFEAIWGTPPGPLLREPGAWEETVDPEDRAAFAEARRRLAEGIPYEIEYRIRRPDSSERWVLDRGFPLPAGPRGPARSMGTAADVTERKGLEADLLQAQKMEFIGKLAGGVAHDFNNLLTIISGYVSMLLDKQTLPPEANEALRRVFTASRQATGLVRQLLLFSRKRAPKREVIDLNAEVEAMAAMLRRLLGETFSVDFEPSPDAPKTSADTSMLEQVLMNMAINARDAMPRGGRLGISVGLRPRQDGKPPSDGIPRTGEYACLSVRDTGCGIAPAILPKLFKPFFTTKDEGRGTGLGLATALDIVRRHDGWIDVESEVGTGTVFRIYLPLTSARVPASPEREPREASGESKGLILLVEDEAAVREFAAAVLQQDGYTLLQARSAENALEVWKWHSAKIDLLLTDVVLPGDLSGPQLAARLQAEKPSLRAVLATGYSKEIVGQQSPGAGSLVVLGKPYTPRTLLRAVKESLAPGKGAPAA